MTDDAVPIEPRPFTVEVLTIFPDFFRSPFDSSLFSKAVARGLVDARLTDIREHAPGKHRMVDDSPYGGGPGMVMKVEPFFAAIEAARARAPEAPVLLTSPRGEALTQRRARRLAGGPGVIIACGHYEGVDERVREYVDEEISIGDYILSGGESAALVVVDAVTRLLPGFVSTPGSLEEESFEQDMLEYPHYTRPVAFRDAEVPEVLRSGDHAAIAAWRRDAALRITRERRPDLLDRKKPRDEPS